MYSCSSYAAGFRNQWSHMVSSGDWMRTILTTPLLTMVFVSLFLHADRGELISYAVLAPGLMAMWSTGLVTAGELITFERENGSLEALLAAPASLTAVIYGKITAITTLSLVGFVEAWIVGSLMAGYAIPIWHPWLFAAAIIATVAAMICWSAVMSGIFVLARSARTFQNSLSYPFYVLGGVLVPVSMLPTWVEGPSHLVFLSWSSDLLRDSLTETSVEHLFSRLMAIVVLGACGLGLGLVLLQKTINRVKTTGSATHA